jgi:opacity protein-like surface antigen
MRKTLIILLLVAFGFSKSYSQDFSKSSLFGGIGVGSSNNSRADGLGIKWSIGYQRDIWKNKLRIVPSINFGSYTNIGKRDVPDAYYNSTSLKVNLNFDVLKIESFSLFIGSGVTANYSSGLIGTGGDPGRSSSEYFNESNFTFNGLIGLRLYPVKNRVGYELLLLDGSLESKKHFSELTVLKLRIILKLK